MMRIRLAAALVLALAPSCVAQISRVAGAIQGNVVDQTGSAVAGASVRARNRSTNQSRTMLTNAEGYFRVGELPVGQYELHVESSGFSPYVNAAIVVSIGRVVLVVVRLAPATAQQQITVSEQALTIDPPKPLKQRRPTTSELRNLPWSAGTTSTSCFWHRS
jgi:hypothetical protein